MTETAPGTTTWTVGQVAERSGVTVRTLHHYDEIGLLRPSRRSASGYRLYTEADLVRLRHVVVYRRLGVALEGGAGLLDETGAGRSRSRRSRSSSTTPTPTSPRTCADSGPRSRPGWTSSPSS